jgi:hypothetical protein
MPMDIVANNLPADGYTMHPASGAIVGTAVKGSPVSERIKAEAKYLVLKYLRKNIIGLEHIVNYDMLGLARLYVRALRLQKQIVDLRQASERRSQRRAAALWGTW